MNKDGDRVWWIPLDAVGHVAAALGQPSNLVGWDNLGFLNEFPR